MSSPDPLPRRHLRLVPPLPPATPRPRLFALPPLPAAPARPHPDDAAPEPTPAFVKALAVQGYEVLAGSRTIAQLGPLVSVGLARELAELRAVRNDRSLAYRDDRQWVPQALGARISRPRSGIAEAAVVLRVGARACAVALRLEWAHRHWRATRLTVL